MTTKEIIAQALGIIGMVIFILSFQVKENKKLVLIQGIGGFMFFLNFMLIGAVAGALLNLCATVRGLLLMKNPKKTWKIVVIELLLLGCTILSVSTNWGDWLQIALAVLVYIGLALISFYMWKDNGKQLRICQVAITSPAWLIHNIFNFTIGGLICETFNIISVIVSFIRYGKNGFEE